MAISRQRRLVSCSAVSSRRSVGISIRRPWYRTLPPVITAGRPQQPGGPVGQRRLAGAALADQAHDLAGVQVQAHPVDRAHVAGKGAVDDRKIANRQHRLAGEPPVAAWLARSGNVVAQCHRPHRCPLALAWRMAPAPAVARARDRRGRRYGRTSARTLSPRLAAPLARRAAPGSDRQAAAGVRSPWPAGWRLAAADCRARRSRCSAAPARCPSARPRRPAERTTTRRPATALAGSRPSTRWCRGSSRTCWSRR